MAYPKEEMKAMVDKCKEDYREYCRNNGINYELKKLNEQDNIRL